MPIAIYHLEAKVITRGTGRSAVAAAAYMSCSRIYNDYDGVTHDYTRKRGLIYEQVFLPEHAPKEWSDRSILWNAVEEAEKTKDSRLSRELVIALPVEFDLSVWERMLQEYIKCNFVNRGMCADLCIHDTDGHNPHAHIMLTVRPLNKDGTWQRKTEKEYLCIRNGEERGFTSSEYKAAQKDGWEKQYLYKIGKKKEYLPPSKAEGLERVNKYPKSTKYGRQNPMSEAWNSEETLLEWRERWASLVNSYFRDFEMDESIDHRSFRARGIKKQPTVHVGVSGFAIVRKKRYCDRYELNRLIRQDNQFIDDIVKTIEYLVKTIALAVGAIADALEVARVELICLKYRERRLNIAHTTGKYRSEYDNQRLKAYHALTVQIEQKTSERNEAVKESKRFFLKAERRTQLTREISKLTNEIKDLESRRNMLLEYLKCKSTNDIPQAEARIKETEDNLPKIQAEWDKTDEALDEAIAEYGKLKAKASDFDNDELDKARKSLRVDKESEARKKIQEEHGHCDEHDFTDINTESAFENVALGEYRIRVIYKYGDNHSVEGYAYSENYVNVRYIGSVSSIVKDGIITKEYNRYSQVWNESTKDFRVHLGIDVIAGGDDKGVYSPMDGRVVEVTDSKVSIRYADSIVVVYESLSSILVSVGDIVIEEQKIGELSCTYVYEVAEEDHLHLEVLVNGTKTDPLEYFEYQN